MRPMVSSRGEASAQPHSIGGGSGGKLTTNDAFQKSAEPHWCSRRSSMPEYQLGIIPRLGAVLDVILGWKAHRSMSYFVKLRYILKVISAAAWVIILYINLSRQATQRSPDL